MRVSRVSVKKLFFETVVIHGSELNGRRKESEKEKWMRKRGEKGEEGGRGAQCARVEVGTALCCG